MRDLFVSTYARVVASESSAFKFFSPLIEKQRESLKPLCGSLRKTFLLPSTEGSNGTFKLRINFASDNRNCLYFTFDVAQRKRVISREEEKNMQVLYTCIYRRQSARAITFPRRKVVTPTDNEIDKD